LYKLFEIYIKNNCKYILTMYINFIITIILNFFLHFQLTHSKRTVKNEFSFQPTYSNAPYNCLARFYVYLISSELYFDLSLKSTNETRDSHTISAYVTTRIPATRTFCIHVCMEFLLYKIY
jgi:hypothetical protein